MSSQTGIYMSNQTMSSQTRIYMSSQNNSSQNMSSQTGIYMSSQTWMLTCQVRLGFICQGRLGFTGDLHVKPVRLSDLGPTSKVRLSDWEYTSSQTNRLGKYVKSD
jgi:hypothetical protein